MKSAKTAIMYMTISSQKMTSASLCFLNLTSINWYWEASSSCSAMRNAFLSGCRDSGRAVPASGDQHSGRCRWWGRNRGCHGLISCSQARLFKPDAGISPRKQNIGDQCADDGQRAQDQHEPTASTYPGLVRIQHHWTHCGNIEYFGHTSSPPTTPGMHPANRTDVGLMAMR